jgi:radical SAM superfamily enzyme YgiQ (UPF0313 family)
MQKIMLIYPPGEKYQRGEDRCQAHIDSSVANGLRACNDLGYASAILKKQNYQVFLKDYQGENLSFSDFVNDFKNENPDAILISTTNGSIFQDIQFINKIKKEKQKTIIILKGALFFNPTKNLFEELDLSNIDYLIGGEIEFIIKDLINFHYNDISKVETIEGISYKKNNEWISNPLNSFNEKLDMLPFPDREAMNNKLYLNPLTNRPMATIMTSKGCPSSCIYCLSPIISGTKVRFRSTQSIVDELVECYEKYNIKDFFFKSDTFTIDTNWAIELCKKIKNSKLHNKITWTANTRANTLNDELLEEMAQAGCSIIAIGLESGNNESLNKMKKGTSLEINKKAIKLIKKHNLKIFGFYLIGFPWETKQHLEDTKKFIFEADTDFLEISIVVPFKGTPLYNELINKNQNSKLLLGKDSFKNFTMGTKYLTIKELSKFKKETLLKYHLRISYIAKKIFSRQLTPKLFLNYVKYGIRLLKNTLFSKE